MLERDRQRIDDLLAAADELAESLQGLTKARFVKDRDKQRVAERLLEIAGEAATHVGDGTADGIDVPWRDLRRLRILLAHAYHRVDPGELWIAATVSLPRFAQKLRSALE